VVALGLLLAGCAEQLLRKCTSEDECAKNGCEMRATDEGYRALICRDTMENGCWRLRSWIEGDPMITKDQMLSRVGPWHCPETGT
jgi:hypothetical protein